AAALRPGADGYLAARHGRHGGDAEAPGPAPVRKAPCHRGDRPCRAGRGRADPRFGRLGPGHQADRCGRPAREHPIPPRAAGGGMMAKVLVVDDVPDNVKLLAYELSDHGHEVVTAFDGLRALEVARSEQPDVILLDIMMPGIDGIEVCRRMKADAG